MFGLPIECVLKISSMLNKEFLDIQDLDPKLYKCYRKTFNQSPAASGWPSAMPLAIDVWLHPELHGALLHPAADRGPVTKPSAAAPRVSGPVEGTRKIRQVPR